MQTVEPRYRNSRSTRSLTRIPFLLASIFAVTMGITSLFYSRGFPERGAVLLERLEVPYPAVVAHRGASTVAPESTRPAYERASAEGADYLEADLRRTADGRIVVFHDSTLRRTSNVEELFPGRARQAIGTYTYEELERLDFGSWFNKKHPLRREESYEGLSILTLKELLRLAKEAEGSSGLVLEIKEPAKYPGIEEDILQILKEEGWVDSSGAPMREGSLIFFSFSLESLLRLRQLAPRIPRVFLISGEMISWMRWHRWVRRVSPVVDGVGAKGFLSWPWYIGAAHNRGLFVLPYVVNEFWQIKLLAEHSADGYITDRPDFARTFVERARPPEDNESE